MGERRTDRPTPEQKALVKALREADRRAEGRSAEADLWPAIRGRVGGRTTDETRVMDAHASEDRAADGPRTRRQILVPNRPLGWALAVISVLIVGAGAYGAYGPLREVFQDGRPGSVGSGSDEDSGRDRGAQQGGDPSALRTQMDQTKTADGVRITLDWAYADSRNVVVGYNLEDLEGDRRVNGHPAEIGARGILTDESGTDFDGNGGHAATTGNLKPLTEMPNVDVFAPEKAVEPGSHEFRLKVPIAARALPRTGLNQSEPVGEPFVFDLEIPVRPAPVIETDQTVEAHGVALTLKRVVDSPARPQAVFCLDPPVEGYYWFPTDEHPMEDGLTHEGGPVAAGEGYCAEVLLADALEGRSSLTVTELQGSPRDRDSFDYRTIRGPWTFEFEAPEP